MGVNVFVPVGLPTPDIVADIESTVNAKAKGRFDWAKLYEGPEGPILSLDEALAFESTAAPYWVLLDHRMVKVKDDNHWRKLLVDSGCDTVVFLKARG